MKLFRNGLLISLFLTFALLLGSTCLSAVTPPDDALKAAQKGLTAFKAINGESMDECAFNVSSTKELEKAVVGYGFRMYTINPNSLCNPGNRLLSGMISPTPTWRFIVLSNNKPIGLITVNQVNGQWQAIGAGAAELAAEVSMVRKSWPSQEGFDYRFVRVYQAKADFMEVSNKKGVMGYIPMKAARVSLDLGQMDMQTNNLMAEYELMEPLRESALSNMKGFKKPDFSIEKEK